MNKGGVGVGSASIILVFAVLCLTVFSLITFVVAGNDKALVQTETKFVLGYYEADALAEQVMAELLKAGPAGIPDKVLGVDIGSDWDMDLWADILYYACPLSEDKELYVKLAVYDDTFDILSWRMRDTGEWEMDTNLNVFMGFDDMNAPVWDAGPPMWDMGD